ATVDVPADGRSPHGPGAVLDWRPRWGVGRPLASSTGTIMTFRRFSASPRTGRSGSSSRPVQAAGALLVATVVATVAGCPDPEQTFDDFGERYDALDPQQSSSSGPVGDCTPPGPADVEGGGTADGRYLFALSA